MPADRLQRDDDRHLDLEQQKNRAKDLRHALQRGDAVAIERLRRHHPGASDLSADELGARLARLSDAQLVIARELGLPSWPKLKDHIDRLDRARNAIATAGPRPDGDMATVHIRCGSDIRDRLKAAGFVGDFLEFSDPLWLGPPARDGLALRARVIAQASGFPEADVATKLAREYQELAAAPVRYARIVIWCEHDPYDQLFLARVLAEFAERSHVPSIELIIIDRFPAIERFIGLGQLSVAALRMLWDNRKPATARAIRLGAAVAKTLGKASPVALGAIAAGGTPELPVMAGALKRHLQELPWTTDGLSLTQRLILQALRDGPRTVSQLFWTTQTETEPCAFLGDLFFHAVVREMRGVTSPPFEIEPETAHKPWPQRRLTLTAAGDAILLRELDWMSLRPAQRWVGGVAVVSGAPVWRWDATHQRPVIC